MKRVMCIWLPTWPLQRLLSARPELEERPLVLYKVSPRDSLEVSRCSSSAAAHGVSPGMPLAEARALLEKRTPREPHFEIHSPWMDFEILSRLARTCRQFSPVVGIEEAAEPESLLLDITGCAPLFGGEAALAVRVRRTFERRGFSLRLAIADSIGAAWALAHYDPESSSILPPGGEKDALSKLPVTALRLPEPVVQTLHDLKLLWIAQVQALPRASLPSRFGPILTQRLDQALGAAPELLIPEQFPEPVGSAWSSGDDALSDRHALEFVLKRLLEEVLEQLAPRQQGVHRLRCQLVDPQRKVLRFEVGLMRPCTSLRHLLEMIQLKIERLSLPEEISDVRIRVIVVPLSRRRQTDLFDDGSQFEAAEQLGTLLERLSNRLGSDSVLRPQLRPDAQPEYAVLCESPISEGKAAVGTGTKRKPSPEGKKRTPERKKASKKSFSVSFRMPAAEYVYCRPMCVKPQPQLVQAISAFPEGPPVRIRWKGRDHVVHLCWGPERIETGWWRKAGIRRDYYRVEIANGSWIWLFRCLDRNQWFVHGVFH